MVKHRKNTLEHKVEELISELKGEYFTVTFYGMWRESEGGWSVNDAWNVRGISRDGLVELVRDRWEVIAANYGRQSVSALEDTGYQENEIVLESNCFPICAIRTEE